MARSVQNKLNAAKKEYHHRLGAGGYRAAVPKWEAFEARLLDNGIIPQTHDWPPEVQVLVVRAWGRVGPTDRADCCSGKMEGKN